MGAQSPSQPATRHQVLLELMQTGLSYREARQVGCEEVLCLLHHARLGLELSALDAEQARVASLAFADPAEQQRMLIALRHRGQALESKFYRQEPDKQV